MADNAWWGVFTFELQQQRCWRIGERAIILKRLENEWNSWNLETPNENNDAIIVDDIEQYSALDEAKFGRYLQLLIKCKCYRYLLIARSLRGPILP